MSPKSIRQHANNDPDLMVELEDNELALAHLVLRCMTAQGVTKAELARRVNCAPSHITQVLSGSRNMTLRTATTLLWALGLGLEISVQSRPQSSYYQSFVDNHNKPRRTFPVVGERY